MKYTTRNTQLTTFQRIYKLSSKADELIRRVAIGERVKEIRESRGESGEAFAASYQKAAKSFGLQIKFDRHKLSRLEGGGRRLTAEEAAIFSAMDPEERPTTWLIFGDLSRVAGTAKFRKVAT